MPNLETIHQNPIEPNISASLIFPNYGQTRLSYVSPFNTVTIRFYCTNKNYDRFIARVTYGDQITSPSHGTLVADLPGANVGQIREFSLDTLQHFPPQSSESGIFQYHLNLYIQDEDGMWNYEYKLFDENGDQIISKNNELLYVVMQENIT